MKDKGKKRRKQIEVATPDEVAAYAADDTTDAPAPQPEVDPQAEPTETGQHTPPQDAETDLQRTERERDDYKDKWLRSKADAQNQVRRLQADREEAIRFANAGFARSVLTVVDDLERTLGAAEIDADAAALAEGVRIVYDHLLKVLSDHQVERIEAVGELFDPTCHEALTQQPSADHPDGTVLQEVQKGYRLRERVLRPARVIVSSQPSDDQQGNDASEDDKG
jgi:molecular chaperone GrpE